MGHYLADLLFKNRIDFKDIFVFSLFSLLVSFGRNNGLYIFAFCLIVLLIQKKKLIFSECRKFFLSSTALLIAIVIIQGPVYAAFHISDSNVTESLGIPIQQIARTISLDGDIPEESKQYFYSILPEEVWKDNYRPLLVDSLKWNDSFNESVLNNSTIEFFKNYIAVGIRNPLIFTQAYLLSTCGFWDPFIGWTDSAGAYVCLEHWPIVQENLNVKSVDVFESIFGFSVREIFEPKLILPMSLFIYVMFVSLSINIITRRHMAMAYFPFLALWLTFMIATPIAYSLRYCFAFVLAIPYFLLLPKIRTQIKSGKKHSRKCNS